MEDRYNGWENRETWAVKLHWDNNQGDQEFFSEHAKKHREIGLSLATFGDFLKEQAEEIFEGVIMRGQGNDAQRMFVQDVGSLWRVNWFEIAEAYYNEVEEE